LRSASSFGRNRIIFRSSLSILSSKNLTFSLSSLPLKRLHVASKNTIVPIVCFQNQKRFYVTEITIKVPQMGDSISEGTLHKWHKNLNDPVKTDDLVATIETDKVNQELRAPESGVISSVFAQEGATVLVGHDLYKISVGAQAKTTSKQPEPVKAESSPAPQKVTPPKVEVTSPKVLPSSTPSPSSPSPSSPSSPPSAPSPPPKEASHGQRTERRVQMNRMRLRIAERLKDAQNTYALLTTMQEADLSNLIALRDEFKDEFQKKHGIKLGFMSAFVKSSAQALVEMPVINAVISGNEIIYRDYIDISVAVATPKGLVVPVLRDCDKMSFSDIEKEIVNLGEKAKTGQITVEDMAGGTFTISNGGVYGSMLGTPIVNPPQSAILGMHAITPRAVVVKNQILIRPMMYLALTYDHRLIDGRDAVTFLRRIKAIIEDPRRLLLDL